MQTLARTSWLVVVDLGLSETLRYLYDDLDFVSARRRGEQRARAEAVERHLPTSYCDVYVVAADDPSRGNLQPNRCTHGSCDGEIHYYDQRDPHTGEHAEAGLCPFWS